MTTLAPVEAATLADAVYGIRQLNVNPSPEDVMRGIKERVGGAFSTITQNWDFEAASVAHGKSGFSNSKESGFAMVVPGMNARKSQTAILFRGTQTKADWGSNLSLGLSTGPAGLQVHTGFNKLYDTLKQDLQSALRTRSGTQMHVVGHSLGGALSNIMCAELAGSLGKAPKLYTFGAPRVGLRAFSSSLEKWLQSSSIYRVYDIADPVPMIPIFPFVHSPLTQNGIRVGVGGGAVNVPSHFMSSYIPRLKGKDWGMLAEPDLSSTNFRDIDSLLNSASQFIRIPGASTGLWALGKVLQALIDVAFLVASPVTTLAFTAIDKIASLLNYAGAMVKKLGSRILKFMEMVFTWLGRSVIKNTIELTTAFLRYVINLLLNPILLLATSALNRMG